MVDCQTVDLEVPGLNPGWGEFFSLKFLLMNHKENKKNNNKENNNSSNS